MPLTIKTQISVADLDFTVQYLLVLSQSNRALRGNIPLYKSVHKITLYNIASDIEKALLTKTDRDFTEAIEKSCKDVEQLIINTIPKSEIGRLKTAIRQKRYQNNLFNRVLSQYNSTLEFLLEKAGK